MQKIRIEIRSMNAGVAARAIAAGLKAETAVRYVGRKRTDVTFETKKSFLAPRQQHPIHASMGGVAGRAALYFRGRMLKGERSALLDVAFRAGLPSGLPHRRTIQASMRIVAITALQFTFRHTMMRGKSELRLDIGVAAEAKIWLGFFE